MTYLTRRSTELVDGFLNHMVMVRADRYRIKGELVYYEPSTGGKSHRPYVLVLKLGNGALVLIREWLSISE